MIKNCSYWYTVYKIFAPFFPICITCYPPMGTIDFRKYLRLFQIKLIKTVEFGFMQIRKMELKSYKLYIVGNSSRSSSIFLLVEKYFFRFYVISSECVRHIMQFACFQQIKKKLIIFIFIPCLVERPDLNDAECE